MHFVKARSRARRALGVLAVTGLALTGVAFTAAQPASAGPLAVTGLTATDQFGQPAGLVWTTEPVTLTVTANANVGGDTLRIVDVSTNTFLGSPCTRVQSCSVSGVKLSTPGQHVFQGQLIAGGRIMSFWDTDVTWMDFPVTMNASETTVPVGQPVTLTMTTTRDIGPSDWVGELFDLTSGTVVCAFGSTTSCSASVTQSVAATHEFVALIGSGGTPGGLSNVRSRSEHWFVTWSDDGWQISLTPTSQTSQNGQPIQVTATANKDVGFTPLCIDVFNETTGQEIGGSPFGSGTVHTFAFTPQFNVRDFLVAFVAGCSTTLPPIAIEASSNVIVTTSVLG